MWENTSEHTQGTFHDTAQWEVFTPLKEMTMMMKLMMVVMMIRVFGVQTVYIVLMYVLPIFKEKKRNAYIAATAPLSTSL